GTKSTVLSLFGHAFDRTEITRRPSRRSRHRTRAPLVFQVATHELGGGLERDRDRSGAAMVAEYRGLPLFPSSDDNTSLGTGRLDHFVATSSISKRSENCPQGH